LKEFLDAESQLADITAPDIEGYIFTGAGKCPERL
jgi:hypothetical protein